MSYSATVSALWLVLVLYWVVSARGGKPTIYRYNPKLRILSLVLVVAMVTLIEDNPRYFFRQIYVPNGAGRAAGLLICAGGMAFAVWARRTLGSNWSADPSIKEGHELIERGPYRLVRHPIYSGFLLALAGTGLGSGRVMHLYIVGISLMGMCLKLRIEESLMLRQFPQAYREYMRRTKALIPFVL